MNSFPLPQPSTVAHTGGGLSTGAVIIAVVAGMLALACLVWALARLRGVEPRWSLEVRHAVAEAGFRASEALAELGDWLRLGR